MRYFLFSIPLFISLAVSGQSYTSYFTGNPVNVNTAAEGGICLMGGAAENDEAMIWFLKKAKGGDILVLRASGSDGYNNYLHSSLGIAVNSVETIVFNSPVASDEPYVHEKINNAEAIWFAGGNQWDYVSYWKNTPIDSLINKAIKNRNIVIGGTSAGMAIQGKFYFTAQNGTVSSSQALHNPYNNNITIDSASFISNNYLQDVITDTHYDNPDRKGRHITFLARIFSDFGIVAKGIACDENTAVCIDKNGLARVFGEYPNYNDNAYFIQTNCELANIAPENCSNGAPLEWNLNKKAIKVYKVKGTTSGSNTFNLTDWKTGTGGVWENWYVQDATLFETAGTQIDCTTLLPANKYLQKNIKVFPNPCYDKINISSGNQLIKKIEIINSNGNILKSLINLNTNAISIGSSKMPFGIYFIKVQTNGAIYFQKLLILGFD
ncbi:MAG: cyanophycinase [Bacteroidetes bacterium 4572_117]|nr:MAG: cyanophycinase [Bacteroidetes bacterium 4572_117]